MSNRKWYPAAEDVVVPWNARYSFPAQANPAIKTTPRIVPKNGDVFNAGSVIRLELPAQGYINPRNTTLSFDAFIGGYSTAGSQVIRFQNNIQSCFQRVRLMYGSTPLEDILNYNVLIRKMTEWTQTSQINELDQTSISEGIGGYVQGNATTGIHVRQKYIQGVETTDEVPSGDVSIRRYTVQLALGLFNQDKLIPIKFMASQLAIEITLAANEDALFVRTAGSGNNPFFQLSNVALLPEILEFDATYDTMFLKGLQNGGVPIKFASWHTYNFTPTQNSNLQIQERSRSLKSLFGVLRRSIPTFTTDSGASFLCRNDATVACLQQYQFRIGGRYYPAAPVVCTTATLGVSNGCSEAFVELQKGLNTLGNNQLQSNVNALTYGFHATTASSESDYGYYGTSIRNGDINSTVSADGGNMGSQQFGIGLSLETTGGTEISGLNAEEQSDVILQLQFSSVPTINGGTPIYTVFAYYDAMLVLRENNVVELIQ
jgi:hypothetical protein